MKRLQRLTDLHVALGINLPCLNEKKDWLYYLLQCIQPTPDVSFSGILNLLQNIQPTQAYTVQSTSVYNRIQYINLLQRTNYSNV